MIIRHMVHLAKDINLILRTMMVQPKHKGIHYESPSSVK